MKYQHLNLGIRLRNPLNIRHNSRNRWVGLSHRTPSVKGFCHFLHFDYGYRAAIVLLKNYIRRGFDTPTDIIMRWAPPSENNTVLYLAAVCGRARLLPTQRLRIEGTDIAHLVSAMARQETGLRITPNEVMDIRERFGV